MREVNNQSTQGPPQAASRAHPVTGAHVTIQGDPAEGQLPAIHSVLERGLWQPPSSMTVGTSPNADGFKTGTASKRSLQQYQMTDLHARILDKPHVPIQTPQTVVAPSTRATASSLAADRLAVLNAIGALPGLHTNGMVRDSRLLESLSKFEGDFAALLNHLMSFTNHADLSPLTTIARALANSGHKRAAEILATIWFCAGSTTTSLSEAELDELLPKNEQKALAWPEVVPKDLRDRCRDKWDDIFFRSKGSGFAFTLAELAMKLYRSEWSN